MPLLFNCGKVLQKTAAPACKEGHQAKITLQAQKNPAGAEIGDRIGK